MKPKSVPNLCPLRKVLDIKLGYILRVGTLPIQGVRWGVFYGVPFIRDTIELHICTTNRYTRLVLETKPNYILDSYLIGFAISKKCCN